MMCGGTSASKPADADIQAIVDEVKGAVENKLGNKLDKYDAVSYKTQVVAGTNYFVKVNIGDEHLHLRIFAPLPHTGASKELSDMQRGKTAENDLEYF
ncbi:cystatin-B-like [Ostrea edulis]|uniref:cystatin-B-like n=1 Tax=Ostrea edulis TaxID=37623 RepID=UPI0024AF4926|nr:cystatin-B-like [Ostrea edulis]